MESKTSGGIAVLVVTFLVALFVFCLDKYNQRQRRRGRVYRRVRTSPPLDSHFDYPGETNYRPQIDSESGDEPWT